MVRTRNTTKKTDRSTKNRYGSSKQITTAQQQSKKRLCELEISPLIGAKENRHRSFFTSPDLSFDSSVPSIKRNGGVAGPVYQNAFVKLTGMVGPAKNYRNIRGSTPLKPQQEVAKKSRVHNILDDSPTIDVVQNRGGAAVGRKLTENVDDVISEAPVLSKTSALAGKQRDTAKNWANVWHAGVQISRDDKRDGGVAATINRKSIDDVISETPAAQRMIAAAVACKQRDAAKNRENVASAAQRARDDKCGGVADDAYESAASRDEKLRAVRQALMEQKCLNVRQGAVLRDAQNDVVVTASDKDSVASSHRPASVVAERLSDRCSQASVFHAPGGGGAGKGKERERRGVGGQRPMGNDVASRQPLENDSACRQPMGNAADGFRPMGGGAGGHKPIGYGVGAVRSIGNCVGEQQPRPQSDAPCFNAHARNSALDADRLKNAADQWRSSHSNSQNNELENSLTDRNAPKNIADGGLTARREIITEMTFSSETSTDFESNLGVNLRQFFDQFYDNCHKQIKEHKQSCSSSSTNKQLVALEQNMRAFFEKQCSDRMQLMTTFKNTFFPQIENAVAQVRESAEIEARLLREMKLIVDASQVARKNVYSQVSDFRSLLTEFADQIEVLDGAQRGELAKMQPGRTVDQEPSKVDGEQTRKRRWETDMSDMRDSLASLFD